MSGPGCSIAKMFCCRRAKESYTIPHDWDNPPAPVLHGINGGVPPKAPKVAESGPSPEVQEHEVQMHNSKVDEEEVVTEIPPLDRAEVRRGGLRGAKVDTTLETPFYEKSSSETELIHCALLNNEFLRGIIPDSQLDKVVGAMKAIRINSQDEIIRQGEHGDKFYVSQSGTYRIIVNDEIVDTFSDQRVFGELAVLYKNPRGATVKALSEGRVWVMNGAIFQSLLIKNARSEAVLRTQFLQKVPSVKEASPDKLAQIAKLMKEVFYRGNTEIIRQGEKGDRFCVIKAGRVCVFVDGKGQVNELMEGQFFGERALIEADVRQATCIAEPPGVTCLELSRDDFDKYLGDFSSFLTESTIRTSTESKQGLSVSELGHDDFDAPGLADLETPIRTIGVGGFGRVVLVKSKQGQVYALKLLNKVDNKTAEQRDHAMNEKHIQITCKSIFIVRLFCTYQSPKYLYFLMEACMGGDLFSLMQKQKGRCFDEEGAQFIAGCILGALEYLHKFNYIYRDLKPENMLIDSEGYIKLADFGFAKKLTGSQSTYTFAGTPEYVAPEVIYSKGHDRAVDYWAYGIFVFELLVGKTPFKTNDPSYMKTYGLILKGIENIQMPSRIKPAANNLIKKLCKLTPHERLGCQLRGVADIRDHRWFHSLDWQALIAKQIKSKYTPKLLAPDDHTYFEDFGEDFSEPEDDYDEWPNF